MKTIITIKIADLNTNRIRVVDDTARANLAAKLIVTDRSGKEIAFDCNRVYADGQRLEFTTHDIDAALSIQNLLTFNLTSFEVEHLKGKLIRVSVLELLDKCWTLTRSLGTNRLRCTPPAGESFTMDFVNDGINLWAEYDGTVRNDVGLLLEALTQTHMTYAVTE